MMNRDRLYSQPRDSQIAMHTTTSDLKVLYKKKTIWAYQVAPRLAFVIAFDVWRKRGRSEKDVR